MGLKKTNTNIREDKKIDFVYLKTKLANNEGIKNTIKLNRETNEVTGQIPVKNDKPAAATCAPIGYLSSCVKGRSKTGLKVNS